MLILCKFLWYNFFNMLLDPTFKPDILAPPRAFSSKGGAYLLRCSTDVTSVLSTAQSFISDFLCPSASLLACKNCEVCKMSYPSLVFSALETGFKIEDSRRLKVFFTKRPIVGERRAAMILLNKSTPEAQNALLKLAEEPPSKSLILFIATTTERVIRTLESRVLSFNLGPDLLLKKGKPLLTPSAKDSRLMTLAERSHLIKGGERGAMIQENEETFLAHWRELIGETGVSSERLKFMSWWRDQLFLLKTDEAAPWKMILEAQTFKLS